MRSLIHIDFFFTDKRNKPVHTLYYYYYYYWCVFKRILNVLNYVYKYTLTILLKCFFFQLRFSGGNILRLDPVSLGAREIKKN